MAQTMAMGHACGTAAALSLQQGVSIPEVDISALQSELRQQGAILEMPGQVADINADGWASNRKMEGAQLP